MKRYIGQKYRRLFILKVDLPAMMAFALFAGLIFFFLIPGFEKVMMDRKRSMIQEMTSTAYSLLEYYHSLEDKGELSADEAKAQASDAISKLRYGDQLKDYFWITDRFPRMIVHPYRSDLNGKDLSDFRDPKGKTVFVEFVRAVSSTGESFVDYMWQWNDDSTRIVPKLSYVRLFGPWDWIIGTGIYVEDVRLEIRKIETLALIVSGSIAIIVVLLLVLISRQSHKIEQERSRAEDELRKSRELYRTLAEATSEGVIIWSSQGLQANKTMLAWLGCNDEELQYSSLSSIINARELSRYREAESLYHDLSTRLSIDCLFRMKDGSHVKSHADLSRILVGGLKAVLVVVRPAKLSPARHDFSLPSPILSSISTGLFRITYGKRNRFLSASQPALAMLGFSSLKDLHMHPLESLFANRAEFKSFRAALAAKENVFGKIVLLKRKDGRIFRALVNAVIVETDTQDIWCEGTIEYISGSVRGDNPFADLGEYSASYLSEIAVSEIMNMPVLCREDSTAEAALAIMKEKQAAILVVVNDAGYPAGTINKTTLLEYLASGRPAGTRLSETDIFPPFIIDHKTSVIEALGLIKNNPSKCLLTVTGNSTVSGIITTDELLGVFTSSPQMLNREIEKADSGLSLHKVYLKSRKLSVSMLLGHADISAVTSYISAVADAICRRAIALCIEKSGLPPCKFAFIQTGSAGRMEQSLLTDQDNAIIIEDQDDADKVQVKEYFLSLGKMINDMLNEAGYRYCKGGNMAGNEKWCQPLSAWKKYFTAWIRTPGPEELMEISIFFDFRFCYGDKMLSDRLREFITSELTTSDIFFHHMAAGWKRLDPSTRDLERKSTDIKRIIMPLTGIIRLYTLKDGVTAYSSVERILELYSSGKVEQSLLNETIRAWKDLTLIRVLHQASCINKGKEPDNIVDFRAEAMDLIYQAEQAVLAVNNLVLKAANDFYADNV